MKYVVLAFVVFQLIQLVTYAQSLPKRGTAPELENLAFLNTNKPLRLADLRGSVILLEFWTFDCINCIRTLPYMQRWHETYSDQGLVVIGNHYPEFNYERDIHNVKAAVERYGLTYPIVQDNDGTTWDAYSQRYWPTLYLIDKWGDIRYMQIGEGRYTDTENAIKALLAETYVPPTLTATVTPSSRQYLTPDLNLNVRTGPGTHHELVGTIPEGAVYIILGEENGWYLIDYNGDERYVSGEHVTVNNW